MLSSSRPVRLPIVTAIAFRAPTDTDIPHLLSLIRALNAEDGSTTFHPERAEAALRELISDQVFGEAWLIEANGAPAGYVVVTIGFSLEFHGRDAFVDELYIVPHLRGAGIGHRAVEHAAERCRARGIGALHLEVDPENERALSLYRRCGFRERGYKLMTRRLSA